MKTWTEQDGIRHNELVKRVYLTNDGIHGLTQDEQKEWKELEDRLHNAAREITNNKITEQDFTRINNDTCGNPRYVIHFLSCCPESWKPAYKQYDSVCKLMNKIGGKKYHNKQYGGGIVFQSYSLPETIASIERMLISVK